MIFSNMIEDRFGPMPEQVTALLDVVRLKWIASNLGIEKVVMKNNLMINHFVSNPQDSYYSSDVFVKLMAFVNSRPRRMEMKQKNSRLSLFIKNISTTTALSLLREIEASVSG